LQLPSAALQPGSQFVGSGVVNLQLPPLGAGDCDCVVAEEALGVAA
jgi:hypothetical protein